MNLDIFRQCDPSGCLSKESYVKNNYAEEYNFIVNSCELDIPFKEKLYCVLNEISHRPTCMNPNCDNLVKFKNSTIGYLKYCSRSCISSDPVIKSKKFNKSMIKYGTKTPAESDLIRSKIIKTNIDKYGYNSPMLNESIKAKSLETLMSNYGVDNPAKSAQIQSKRVATFKSNIDSYKLSYRDTSMRRYGVSHPWMIKSIHYKTVNRTLDHYRSRIKDKTDSSLYEFLDINRVNGYNILRFNCLTCNSEFEIYPYNFYHRIKNSNSICTNCYPISDSSSIKQVELFNYIKSNYDGIILENVRGIIGEYEIDIYLPELKIGFEFNGIYWHSDKFKDSMYHYNKHIRTIENEVKVYSIWEDDWIVKRDICNSFILNKLGKLNRIYARNTIVRELTYNECKLFLDTNHFQGDVKSSKRYGLYNNGELLSVMTFSKLRLPLNRNLKNIDGRWELTRFCNKLDYTIVGGASKLLKHFIKTNNPSEIQSYSDNSISYGDLYDKLGFKYIHDSKPGYTYVINGIREHRFNWRKSRLKKLGYDTINKTEQEIMNEIGYNRVYNSGNKKWIMVFGV